MKNKMLKTVLMTLLCAGFFSFPAALAESQLVDRIVAVVNKEAITQSELDILLRPIFEELKKEVSGQQLYAQLADIRLKLLNQLIEDRLVLQHAQELGVEIDEAEITEQLQEFKSKFKSDAEMDEALRAQGMTVATIRERLRRQAMIRNVHDMEIRSKVVVSPREIEQYYADHPDVFSERDQLRVRSITIKKSEEAKEKGLKDEVSWQGIEQIRQRAVKGENFEELAAKYSEDIHAEKGGLGNWVQKGEMIPVIDEVLFKLKTGEVSQVIETPMGYHLFRIEERKEGSKKTLEESRERIFSILFQEKSEARFKEWMEELKSAAYISVR